MTKSLLVLASLIALSAVNSGCATLDGTFENRLVFTAAGDELGMMSRYGAFGIYSRISDKDLEAIRALRPAAVK